MSVFSHHESSECSATIGFFLWMGIMIGIPSMIWGDGVVVPAVVGISFILTLTALITEEKNDIMKYFPLSVMHIVYLLGYATTMCITIAINASTEGAASVIFPIAAVAISFAVDLIYYVKGDN